MARNALSRGQCDSTCVPLTGVQIRQSVVYEINAVRKEKMTRDLASHRAREA